jgi:hypothetical protein
MVVGTPALHERHPNRAHLCQLHNRIVTVLLLYGLVEQLFTLVCACAWPTYIGEHAIAEDA